MKKKRIPACFISALLGSITYIFFAIGAYIKYPQPFSLMQNWLSDLGNENSNPQGAILYCIGVILCAVFLAIWFTIGQSRWKLNGKIIQHRLLLISQITGALATVALVLSAIYPINHLTEHAFWSDINFILFGISIAFSVSALRYHSQIPKAMLFLGGFAAILPTMVLLIHDAYWMEWLQ